MKIAVFGYVFAGILTYGHAYHSPSLATVETYNGKIYNSAPASKAVDAMFCGVFWPLYWSVHVMQPKETK